MRSLLSPFQQLSRQVLPTILLAWFTGLLFLVNIPFLSRPFSRRRFLRTVAGAGIAVVGVTAGCSEGMGDGEPGEAVMVPASDIPDQNDPPLRSATGKFYLVRNTEGLLAFSWRCTHQGCEVPWKDADQAFRCPCHGSVYDRNGVRLEGPAPRPLDLVRLDVKSDGAVLVDPSAPERRSQYHADQAVPYRESNAPSPAAPQRPGKHGPE